MADDILQELNIHSIRIFLPDTKMTDNIPEEMRNEGEEIKEEDEAINSR